MNKENCTPKQEKKKTTTKKSKQLYQIIDLKLKMEIKLRYEVGEKLRDIANELKINYFTLKNCASAEKWQKGVLQEIVYLKAKRKVIEREEKVKEEHIQDHMYLHRSFVDGLVEDADQGESPTDKTKTEAQKNYMNVLKSSYEFGKDILDIRNAREQIDDSIASLRLEELQEEKNKRLKKIVELED